MRLRRTLERWELTARGASRPWSHALRERGLDPYDRAAIEMAAIELALRQRGTTLATLAGVTPAPVRTVVSFGRVADPVAEAARRFPDAELKVDVDPAWPDDVWRGLRATGRVAILDWKGDGDAAAYGRALALLPEAVHEDPAEPYPAGIAERVSLDASITEPAALDGVAPFACNLKPARMGERARRDPHGRRAASAATSLVYVGGMFEIGVGRRQLRDLASRALPRRAERPGPDRTCRATTNP